VSVLADRWELTAKCLRPLPDKHGGLADRQTLARQPYLDLIANPAARGTLRTRCTFTHGLRESLLRRGYLEVDPPPAPGPYLTELCVGGMERVFAVGRGVDSGGGPGRHDTGSTLVAYQTYADHAAMRDLARALVEEACVAAHGHGFDGQWRVVPLYEAISRAVGEAVTPDVPADRLHRLAVDAGITADATEGAGPVALVLYRRLVVAGTTAPTFYAGFPADAAPAARPDPDRAGLAQRWDLVASVTTLATGWSVPVDPARCEPSGRDPTDRDGALMLALEYGMPPTGAVVLHVDRLAALLTDGC
jgi:lysyl-tRNA synthetase class 2